MKSYLQGFLFRCQRKQPKPLPREAAGSCWKKGRPLGQFTEPLHPISFPHLLILPTYQSRWCPEKVAERIIEEVHEGSSIEVCIAHQLIGKEGLMGATVEETSHLPITHVHLMGDFLQEKSCALAAISLIFTELDFLRKL